MYRIGRTGGTVRIEALALAIALSLGGGAVFTAPASAQTAPAQQAKTYRIAAGTLEQALNQLAIQSGLQILFDGTLVSGRSTPGFVDQASAEGVLRRLLEGTGLTYEFSDAEMIVVKRGSAGPAASAPAPATRSGRSRQEKEVATLPELLVKGERGWSLNADIRRTVDDPQPYVVFEREQIERSGALTLEAFVRDRLTMNTAATTQSQSPGAQGGSASTINLRGLGVGQTLLLVDGRRIPDFSIGNMTNQASINGIPIDAVERIEVLPTTAGGIYGGSATGGVVNIILRRDYAGVDVKLTHDNTFDSDSSVNRIDISSGFSWDEGRSHLLLAATYSEGNNLLLSDRDFARRGRARILENNPGFFFNAATPPLGALPNIRSQNGSPLVLRNGTALGSAITFVPAGYAGTSTDGGLALVANAGQYNLDLAQGLNNPDAGGGRLLLKGPRLASAMGTLRKEFSDRVSGFLDASMSESTTRTPFAGMATVFTVAATAPNNPFQQAISVAVPSAATDGDYWSFTEEQRVSGGIIVQLPRAWQLAADYTWHRYTMDNRLPSTLTAAGTVAIRDGVVDVLRDLQVYPLNLAAYIGGERSLSDVKSRLGAATVRVGGPVLQLPGGAMEATVLLERRDMLANENLDFFNGAISAIFPERSQKVDSVYTELRVPFVSERNARAGVQALELQLAGRWDRYTTRSGKRRYSLDEPVVEQENQLTSTNPTIALRYQPFQDLALRASYGTGFLPPSMDQVNSSPFNSSLTVQDIRRGGETVTTLWRNFGGSSTLQPEESESWSAGLILTPRWVPGLRVSLDYSRIKKTNNIYQTFTGQFFVDNELRFPETVTRGPVADGDPYGVGPIVAIDTLLVNISQAEVEAYDLQFDYGVLSDRLGSFDFYALATWQTHYRTQVSPDLPVVENVGIGRSNPLKFRANGGVNWRRDRWSAGWSVRYLDSYVVSTSPVVLANQGRAEVDDQIYHDAFVGYRLPDSARWLSSAELQLGIRNLFDKAPPFDATDFPYYSTFGDPRMASYYVSLRKSF